MAEKLNGSGEEKPAACEAPRIFRYGDREIEWLKRRDKRLGAAIEAVHAAIGRVERRVDADLFSAVVHHIVGQQISTKAQETVWQRLCDALGAVNAETVMSASIEALQACGMTFRKAEYIRDFASKVMSGQFDPEAVARLPDEEAIAALVALRGIGVWTAEMILLFCLERPDVLSFGDLAILRGMRMVYRHKEITRERFERIRRRLSPCGSVASLYFWAIAGGSVPGYTDPAPKVKKQK